MGNTPPAPCAKRVNPRIPGLGITPPAPCAKRVIIHPAAPRLIPGWTSRCPPPGIPGGEKTPGVAGSGPQASTGTSRTISGSSSTWPTWLKPEGGGLTPSPLEIKIQPRPASSKIPGGGAATGETYGLGPVPGLCPGAVPRPGPLVVPLYTRTPSRPAAWHGRGARAGLMRFSTSRPPGHRTFVPGPWRAEIPEISGWAEGRASWSLRGPRRPSLRPTKNRIPSRGGPAAWHPRAPHGRVCLHTPLTRRRVATCH